MRPWNDVVFVAASVVLWVSAIEVGHSHATVETVRLWVAVEPEAIAQDSEPHIARARQSHVVEVVAAAVVVFAAVVVVAAAAVVVAVAAAAVALVLLLVVVAFL